MKNTYIITILISALCLGCTISGSAQNSDCTQCEGGTISGTNASVVGKNNTASGNNAFAGGYNSTASGSNSLAFGYGSKASQSTNLALGNTAEATGIGTVAIGNYVKASAQNSFVFGSGTTTSYPLTNSTPNSIAFGVNSKKPTLLITKALNNNYTGKVAIGPVTTPQAKLHIKSDTNEDAGVIIEPSNKTSKKAFLYLSDSRHKLVVEPSGNMELSSGGGFISLTGDHYCFGGSDEAKTRLYTNGTTGIYNNVKRIKNTEIRDVDAPSYGIDFCKDGLHFRTAISQPQRGSEITNWKEALFLFTNGRIGIGSKDTYIENKDDQTLILCSPAMMDFNANQINLNSGQVTLNGKIGINTTNDVEDYALAVNGGVITTKVYVKEVNNWPDYVFNEDYTLLTLNELKDYVEEHRHLPGVPSEKELAENGYDIHEIQHVMMEKIEEMTRYILILQAEIDSLKSTTKTRDIVHFSYDDNGNRIARSLSIEKIEQPEKTTLHSPFNDFDIYPNPTQGQFTVVIKSPHEKDPLHATLLNATGSPVEERMIHEQQTVFDLSAYSNGIYLLIIDTPEGAHSWKIIKK